MILDNDTQLITEQSFDLHTLSPGTGQPISMRAEGIGGTLSITTGDTSAAADFLTAVDANNSVSFTLPAVTKRYIKATFEQGTVSVLLDSQTNS